MKFFVLAAAVIGALAVGPLSAAAAGHRVENQQAVGTVTPTVQPSPTPTSTPISAPGPTLLLQQANTALIQANTFHFHAELKLDLLGLVAGGLVIDGDQALKQQASVDHETGTLTSLGKKEKVNQHDIQIKNKSWIKSKKTHNKWTKQKSSSSTATSSGNPLDVTSDPSITVADMQTVGSQSINGVVTWHIHIEFTQKIDSTHKVKGTVDYLIGQTDSLPYEIAEEVNEPAQGYVLDLREDLTKFGEKLKIKAPKVGSAKP